MTATRKNRLANNSAFTGLRKRLCDEGILDTVITLSDDTFNDAKVCTSLIVLNRKKTDDKVTFIYSDDLLFAGDGPDYDIRRDATSRNRVQVSYSEMAEVGWSLNARLYLSPDPKCNDGQVLVKLKDLIVREARYDSHANGNHVLSMCSCSDSVIEAMGELRYSKAFGKGASYCAISQPAVLFYLGPQESMNAAVYDSCEQCFIDDTVYTLIPDTAKILPQYLAYVILHNLSFRKYLWDLMEYPEAFDQILPEYILNAKIPIYTDIQKQKQVIDALLKGKEGSKQYNVLIASADEDITGEERLSLLSRCNLRVVGTAASALELDEKLKSCAQGRVSSSDKIDAVIVDVSIPSGRPKSLSLYDGFIEISSSIRRQNEIPFYVMSDMASEELQVPYFCIEYFISEEHRRFFSKDINKFQLLLNSLIDELETIKSDDSVLRNKYPEFYEAADWIDEQRPGKDFAMNITEALKQDMNLTQDEMDKSVNDLRILAEDLITWIQDVNLAPKGMTPGGVAILLRDKICGEYKYCEEGLMDKALASMLVTLYDIGNAGSHKFLSTDLFKRTAVLSLMAFVQWTYQNRDLFGRTHNGYYRSNLRLRCRNSRM